LRVKIKIRAETIQQVFTEERPYRRIDVSYRHSGHKLPWYNWNMVITPLIIKSH